VLGIGAVLLSVFLDRAKSAYQDLLIYGRKQSVAVYKKLFRYDRFYNHLSHSLTKGIIHSKAH